MSIPVFAAIFVGGGLGAMSRHAVGIFMTQKLGAGFPFGTLAVNLLGAFLIGMLAELLAFRDQPPEALRALLVTGFLGGFTTFSAFSLEAGLMLERGAFGTLAIYLAASVIGTIAMVMLAAAIMRQMA
ncbi:MAG: fluoride efflux transporter CrcB [Alphaproteobacteria bacterium]|nr:fluoride efflux transporter CrcB [Alphaproteobacteria bacterium]